MASEAPGSGDNASVDDPGDLPSEPIAHDNTPVAASAASSASVAMGASSALVVLAATRPSRAIHLFVASNVRKIPDTTIVEYFNAMDGITVVSFTRRQDDANQAYMKLSLDQQKLQDKPNFIAASHVIVGKLVNVSADESKGELLNKVPPELREGVIAGQICKFHAIGSCSYGDQCWFSHEVQSISC